MSTAEQVKATLDRRYRAERRFKVYGILAIAIGLAFLLFLFSSIIGNGYTAFQQTHMQLSVELPREEIDPEGTGDPEVIKKANFDKLVKLAMVKAFPDVARGDWRKLFMMVSNGASYDIRNNVTANPDLVGQTIDIWVPTSADVDMLVKGYIDRELPESDRILSDKQIQWVDQLAARDRIEKKFNTAFFINGDSRDAEQAGIGGAVAGSFYTLLITLALSFPIGVMAAVYLEEFAPKNRWTDLIEVNINNLAAVPSIVFGLLGLAVFINFFGMPRSVPLVGGLVLTLMTLPTIIIASRSALKSVPPSIREGALGIGASKMQMVTHHVLPLALPGMLTGAIIGMAQALGESAPLLMIGMVAFIVDIPGGFTDPATVLPVQVFLWADAPERAFVERTSAAIMVLLAFLITMNALAVYLRKKFERRW